MAFLKCALDPLRLNEDEDMGTCFITAGTSVVGYRVAKGLLEAGHKDLRVGIWKGKRQHGVEDESIGQKVSDEFEALGAKVIKFDWTDQDEYKMALAGVKTVFCTLPHMEHEASAKTFAAFEAACRKYGVEHFVKTSVFVVGNDPYKKYVPYVRFHRECDEILTKTHLNSRMSYTILRASNLMSDLLMQKGPYLRDEGKYVTASYGMGVNYVSPNVVAVAALASLGDQKTHRNKIYEVTGVKPIRDVDVCKVFSEFVGKELEHVAIGYHEIEEELKNQGYPAWLIKDIAGFERARATGVEERVSGTTNLKSLFGANSEILEEYLGNKEAMTIQENAVFAQEEQE